MERKAGMNQTLYLFRAFCIVLPLLLNIQSVSAQISTLDKPARTVFKCNVGGKVIYSDDPCVGAQRINVEPTRGLNKSSGKELTGPDVAREKNREIFAEAIKPLTGMTQQQFEAKTRRVKLTPEVKSECARLDASIAFAEVQERAAAVEARPNIQNNLFILRKRYREIAC
ncbi:MAG: hypothetical protein Q7J75_01755 [Rhodoferax sp.]|nr:hypothetical protein [Rhodoferax sp.]